jgi:PAS domain S-box-containing protein
MNFRAIWDRLTSVPAVDPLGARDRAMLYIVLAGLVTLALVILAWTYVVWVGADTVTGWTWEDYHEVAYGWSAGILIVCGAVYLIDRYGPRTLGRALLPLFLVGVLIAADLTEEIANGRSTFGFLVPICVAALVWRPWGGLPIAGLSSLVLVAARLDSGVPVDAHAPLAFLATALLLWPTARGLRRLLLSKCQIGDSAKPTFIADVRNLLRVPAGDPDYTRRRKLANLLLVTSTGIALAVVVATAIGQIAGLEYSEGEPIAIDWAAFSMMVVLAILILINRFRYRGLASALMLLCMVIYTATSDIPEEIADGRTTLTFVFPIVLASFLLPPYASFIVAALSIVIISAYAVGLGWTPNPYHMLALMSMALLSWLAARSLEQTVQEARSEASHKQAILESIADGVVVFDDRWCITAANPAMAALAGMPAADLVGQDIGSLIPMGDIGPNPARKDATQDTLASSRPARFVWNAKTLSATLSTVLDASGRRTGTVAVLRDVTREVEVERARESLFAVTAHELRTPLNAIINFANMMQAGLLSREQQLNASQRIAVNGERLLVLVNNLLERAKIEAGKVDLNIRSFNVGNMIETVCHTMSVVAREKELELFCRIDEDMPRMLQGDEQRLYQVLVNLISNAIKFTESGSVTVRAYLPDPEHWALKVADTGVGIPVEARTRIFEPFELAQDPSRRKRTGAGLGLSIVRRIVKLMGGEISLESQVGRGSTFTVILPLALDNPGGLPDTRCY